jgi:hypothetical protein
MKNRHKSILLFMIVFTGVTMLAYSPALALQDNCTDPELAIGTCIRVPSDNPVWILRAVDINLNKVYRQNLGVDWPIKQNNKTVFRYITGVYRDAPKPPALSYVWFSLQHVPPLGTSPGGAQLDMANIPSGCGNVELGSRIAYKLNKVASYQKDGIIELYEVPGTGIDQTCGSAAVVWSSDCGGYPQLLLVPSGGDVPIQEVTTFTCEDSGVTVTVTINPCTSEISDVWCEGPESVRGWAQSTSDTWGRAQDFQGQQTDFPIVNIGPGTPGCIVCADPWPVVLRGNKAWWCGGAPPEP